MKVIDFTMTLLFAALTMNGQDEKASHKNDVRRAKSDQIESSDVKGAEKKSADLNSLKRTER
jgi:hypothetical protein